MLIINNLPLCNSVNSIHLNIMSKILINLRQNSTITLIQLHSIWSILTIR